MRNDAPARNADQGIREVCLFAAGAVIGAVAAFLFAPQTGVRTCRQIVRTYEDVRDHAADLCEEAAGRVESLRRAAARQIDSGKDFVAEKRDDFLASLSDFEKSASALTEKLRRA